MAAEASLSAARFLDAGLVQCAGNGQMESTFEEMIDLAKRLGIVVRHVRMGGLGGGLASVKGVRQLFVDLDADPTDQLEQTAKALGKLAEIDTVFLRPDVRDILERFCGGARPPDIGR